MNSHTRAQSIDEATRATGEFRAGGTDLQERLRSRITSGPLIDIQDLPDLDHIRSSAAGTEIGALVTLRQLGEDPEIRARYPGLALPARSLATPQIRAMGTLGGVLCQRTRCWYYRNPALPCPKKGDSSICPAREGNHRFGVCFDLGPCVHPHPSSIACALLAYDAEIRVTGRGWIGIADLYGDGSDPRRDHQLEASELLTHVRLPPPAAGERAAYFRLMSRAEAEWPLVEVVVRLLFEANETIHGARVAIGGVANIPLRLPAVEACLAGKPCTPQTLAAAAHLATQDASPLPQTGYKVPMVLAAVLEALEQAAAETEREGRVR